MNIASIFLTISRSNRVVTGGGLRSKYSTWKDVREIFSPLNGAHTNVISIIILYSHNHS